MDLSHEQSCFKIKLWGKVFNIVLAIDKPIIKLWKKVLNIVLAIDKPIGDNHLYLSHSNNLKQLLLVGYLI